MMQDDTFYKALHDEILSNGARITNLQYWSVVLGTAVLGFLNIPEAPTNPIAVAGLLPFVSLMTLLLFRSVYSTGVSSLRVGTYLLALERKHNQDYGWEHLLHEERGQWKDIKGWALWRQFLDVQVFLQLAYSGVIGYFAFTSGGCISGEPVSLSLYSLSSRLWSYGDTRKICATIKTMPNLFING
jgi:hypothetical protein